MSATTAATLVALLFAAVLYGVVMTSLYVGSQDQVRDLKGQCNSLLSRLGVTLADLRQARSNSNVIDLFPVLDERPGRETWGESS